ncbi:hypothetical protein ABT215_12775 [Streptomyces sp900105755]|uniref:hypothetical protein n=1 Tax=Streptomyces sp. 900105755 TaxID=3154389 RepID=UPI0033304903
MSEATYKARYWQHAKRREEECPTLEEAVTFLAYSLYDYGVLSPADVVGPDGTVVLEGEALTERMMAAYGD